jgi:thioredoxin 2
MRATVECPACGQLNRVELARAGARCGKCRDALATDRPLSLSERGFDRVVADAPVPVLVDFHADWCGPCRMMSPVLEQVARERSGRLLVASVDTDRAPEVARRFGIASLPTLVLLSGGREVARSLGAVPKPRVDALVDGAAR